MRLEWQAGRVRKHLESDCCHVSAERRTGFRRRPLANNPAGNTCQHCVSAAVVPADVPTKPTTLQVTFLTYEATVAALSK